MSKLERRMGHRHEMLIGKTIMNEMRDGACESSHVKLCNGHGLGGHRLRLSCLVMLLAFSLLPTMAQKKISAFSEKVISNGKSCTINGVAQTEPDVYFTDNGDGTYTATRLTVQPVTNAAAITAPYLNNCTSNSIQVCWKTSTNAEGSVVRYGKSKDALTMSASNKVTSLSTTYFWNVAKLEGLEPNTVYYYQVDCKGTLSAVNRFRTMPEAGDKGKVRILMIGDHQRCDHSDYEWMLKDAKRTLDEKFGEAPLEDHVRFLLNDGDQVDEGALKQYEFTHLYKSRDVMGHLPIMTTVGNHELVNDANLALYNGHYAGYGDLDYQGIKSGTANYYAYQVGSVLFVDLNSDGTTATQKTWLRKVIAAADKDASVTFIVSLQHRPLYAEQYCTDVSPWMLNEIMPILCSSSKHVLNCAGHHHLYARGQMTDWPVYHIITGGGVGTSASGYEQLWGTTPDNLDNQNVQKTIDQWTYQIMEFDPENREMTVESYSVGNARLALDNVLVDKFTRKLDDVTAPERPTLDAITANTLPMDVTEKAAGSTTLHSAEYQVAKDADFSDVVLDKVVTFEDYYGANADFTPKDLNAGKPVTQLTIASGELVNGNYYIRVRNRNMNLNWSDYSAAQTFEVTGQTAAPALSLSKACYQPGESITCTFANAPVDVDAWVGIYEHGKTPGSSTHSIAYQYTKIANGTLTFSVTDANEYFMVLFKNSGYDEATAEVPFLVTANTSDEKPFAMTLDHAAYDEGAAVKVTLANAPCLTNDWVGIYERSITPKNAICPTWRYVGSTPNTSMDLNVAGSKNYSAPLPAGIYYVGYFQCDAYTEMFPRQYFVVGHPAVIETTKSLYDKGETVDLVYEGAPGWDSDKVTIIDSEGNVVKQFALNGKTGGAFSLETSALASGIYKAYVETDGKAISPEVTFTLQQPTGIHEVSDNGQTLNYSNGRLDISSRQPVYRVDIFNANGSLALSHKACGENHVSMNLSLASGVYLVRVNKNRVIKMRVN
jgi:hypothetical protein